MSSMHQLRTRIAALLAVLASFAVVQTAPAVTADPALRVVGIERIGDFRVRGGTIGDAVAAFGTPTFRRDNNGACDVGWRALGLTTVFYTLSDEEQCSDGSSFNSAKLSGSWTTARGLARGDSLDTLFELYPRARKAPGLARLFAPRPAGSAVYGLTVRFSQAIGPYGLAVEVVGGKTTRLFLYHPQGGE